MWDLLRTTVFVPMVLCVFDDVLMTFGVGGLHLQPERHHLAPWWLPWLILERFGWSFGRHLGSLGDYMEPYLSLGCPLLGVFLVQFIVDIVSVVDSCQNCLKIVCPRTA